MIARLAEPRLAIPGVIGIDHRGIVAVGPDAGFPFHPIDDWKHEVPLVESARLDDAVRAELELPRPERVIAALDDAMREMRELDLDPAICDDLAARGAAELVRRARWLGVTDAQRDALVARGVPVWCAGFTRSCGMAWVRRPDDPASAAYVMGWGDSIAHASEVHRARWIDRVLRAASGGAIGEAVVSFADAALRGALRTYFVADAVADAGAAAAARIAAGDDEVELPLHGVARRVHLAAAVVRATPDDCRYSAATPRPLEVPADDVWIAAPR
jgi:hypothetical protein